jgi:predicted component of type VI protein secretion system
MDDFISDIENDDKKKRQQTKDYIDTKNYQCKLNKKSHRVSIQKQSGRQQNDWNRFDMQMKISLVHLGDFSPIHTSTF